ncbi:hypothetical protein L7F22_040721 [Adiantum nelumboides]|nr:hypothetical protein [Adiantum nelumboides]MCO5586779.1 hypothetical protein [Adiantum nelumboides]
MGGHQSLCTQLYSSYGIFCLAHNLIRMVMKDAELWFAIPEALAATISIEIARVRAVGKGMSALIEGEAVEVDMCAMIEGDGDSYVEEEGEVVAVENRVTNW